MNDPAARRPLATRNRRWVQALARRLAATAITPNQISMASAGFAALGFLAFWGTSAGGTVPTVLLLLLAAAAIQLRLLCNLLDGMVAIEGGKSAPTGPFWNEAPDRAADLLFFWGAGLAAGGPALGLGCGALALATAYLRELGRAEGLGADFAGPMAKQHRMAALTVASLAAAVLPAAAPAVLTWALWLILVGTAATVIRRASRLTRRLTAR